MSENLHNWDSNRSPEKTETRAEINIAFVL